MDKTKPQDSMVETTKPESRPIQVVQFVDGHMAILSNSHIAFGDGLRRESQRIQVSGEPVGAFISEKERIGKSNR